MESFMDENGNITLVQGDSFEFVVNGLPTDQLYKVFFAAQDEERNPVGNEIEVEALQASTVTIFLEGNFTDLFTVSEDKKTQNYYYGIKLCSLDGIKQTEKTLLIGNAKMGDRNVITVYPRKVKGV